MKSKHNRIESGCPSCGATYRFSATNVGRDAHCKQCGERFSIRGETIGTATPTHPPIVQPSTGGIYVSTRNLVAVSTLLVASLALFVAWAFLVRREPVSTQPIVNPAERTDVEAAAEDNSPLHGSETVTPSLVAVAEQDKREPVLSKKDGTSDNSHEMRDAFQIGDFFYQIAFCAWVDRAGVRYDLGDAKPYLVLMVVVSNQGKKSHLIPTVSLVDQLGAEHTESGGLMLHPNAFGILKSLNPGMAEAGLVAFEVTEDRQYKAKLSGGYLSGTNAFCNISSLGRFRDLDEMANAFNQSL